ncbi:MAG: hypothetical protein LBH28_01210 [Oscillospiraceae bacterium]|jgi:hypothetical protein|nr:hypothetical protein [Oscillospiraceae bacterium]
MTEQDIIALQKKVMQEQFSSIHSIVTYVAGKRYHFVEHEISLADILIHLPREFVDLPPIIAKQKYPSENRPKIIKTSLDISVNFAFNSLPQEIQVDDLIVFRDSSLDALKKLYPHNTYLERGLDYYGPTKSKLFSWYEYCGPTLDADSYTFSAFMRENRRLLFYLFNCPMGVYESWRPVVFETILSIRDKPIDWKGESES